MQPFSWKDNLIYGLIAFLIIWFNRHHFFFWDTVQLTSKHAHWFYEQGFSTFFLPQKYDSGHPPFWGMYHATLWKVFGKTLVVSHFGMWPFLFGVFYFTGKIGQLMTQNQSVGLLFGLFLLADPVFLTQATLISPDIALVCFFLMVLYGILQYSERKPPQTNWAIIIGSLGLAMISLRGMMTLAGLGLFLLFNFGIRQGLRKMLNFLPGILVGFGFLIIHYFHTKWIGYHVDSPWAESFQLVDYKGFVKNIAILAWRFIDVGRIFVWILMVFIWIRYRSLITHRLWQLFGFLAIFLLPTFLGYNGLNGMRYLMPLLITLNLIFVMMIWHLRKHQYQRWMLIYIFAFLAFATGNIWKYPAQISTSWDTTLLHQPYYGLRQKMMMHIQKENIPISKIATAFPNTATLEIIDLNNISERMIAMDDSNADYYFISNIFNDIKHDKNNIELDHTLLKKFQTGPIWVALYRIKH